MKPSNESREHEKIHTIKEELHEEAIAYLKSDKIGRRLNEIIGDGALWDTVQRIITRELTGSERWKIRNMALGNTRDEKRELKLQRSLRRLLKRVRAANGNTASWQEQQNNKPLYTLEAIKDWLWQLWNVEIVEKPGKSGPEFFASIWGITLWRSLLVGSPHDREITGETAEAAMRNYFTEARLATDIEWQNWKKYRWVQKDLQFMEKESRALSPVRIMIRRKRLKQNREKLKKTDWQKYYNNSI